MTKTKRAHRLALIATILVSTSSPTSTAWSQQLIFPAGATAASYARSLADHLPSGCRKRLGTVRFRHGDVINCIVYSADGRLLASGGAGGKICIWNPICGRLMSVTISPDIYWQPISWIAFREHGRQVLVGKSNCIDAFELGGSVGDKVVQGVGLIGAYALSPDGSKLAWADSTCRIGVYTFDRRETISLKGHSNEVTSLAFSPDGSKLISGSLDKSVRVWNVKSGSQIRMLPTSDCEVRCVAYSPQSDLVAFGGEHSPSRRPEVVTVWDLTKGAEIARFCIDWSSIRYLAISPDGARLAAGASYSKTTVWTLGGKSKLLELHTGEAVKAVAFSPDSRTITTGGSNGSLRQWDTFSGKELNGADVPAGPIRSISVASDGRHLAAGSEDGTVRIWETQTGRQIFKSMNPYAVTGVAFIKGDTNLAWVDDRLKMWHRDPRAPRRVGNILTPGKIYMIYSPTIESLVIQHPSHDRLRFYNLISGDADKYIDPGSSLVCFCASRDGRSIATSAYDRNTLNGSIDLWDAMSGRKLQNLPTSAGPPVECLALSPHACAAGVLAPTGGRNWVIKIYRLISGDQTQIELPKESGKVCSLCFSLDNRMLACGTESGEVILWELLTLNRRGILKAHRGAVRCLAFFDDGTALASGSDDTTVLVWDLRDSAFAGEAICAEASRLEAQWRRLGSADARDAYRAIWQLAAPGPEAVRFLQGRLHPVADVGEKRLNRLVALLNDDQFKIRDEANRELKSIGDAAAPSLRKALSGNVSIEARRRIESLLPSLSPGATENGMRVYRAIEALERNGGNDAKSLLRELARGMPGAWYTTEAETALLRLKATTQHSSPQQKRQGT
jgi:WD40 repeat protein